jgi:hypothetical protein
MFRVRVQVQYLGDPILNNGDDIVLCFDSREAVYRPFDSSDLDTGRGHREHTLELWFNPKEVLKEVIVLPVQDQHRNAAVGQPTQRLHE